ncbi:HAMP domain-containing protein [Piscinibacter sp. Jin2]|uniref:histidine kinase n=1 Tax=Aquariibacter lacus TaxID=2801332 RepID=A0A9X0XE68_9BURK|nr:ATP-binding protein [Piscinibacter lacus]MBL0720627.1 HAMP domain-containing protein [Piscinibacter lacus]
MADAPAPARPQVPPTGEGLTRPPGVEALPSPRVPRLGPLRRLALALGLPRSFSLFVRTLVLLGLLLVAELAFWLPALRSLDNEPRRALAAQHIASLVHLTEAALRDTDPIDRVARLHALGAGAGLRVRPREALDRIEPYAIDRDSRALVRALHARLGPETLIARSVDDQPGLWVSFMIGGEPWWLRSEMPPPPQLPDSPWTWLPGLLALLGTVLASALIAVLINRPLRRLSFAASRLRGGEYEESRLDEDTPTREVREVNRGFNRMARELARVEEERTVMLAGISHDLRTPLARLRLEAEMSVADDEARRHIAEDIDQLDATIDKFMDYARPGGARLQPVHLAGVIDREIAALRDSPLIRVESRVAIDTHVLADELELARVFANLFENARRYGRSADSGIAEVTVAYARSGPWVEITVSDRGPGVPPAVLERLTTPFFRGDLARTAATGAGLGLTIVDKTLQRMGGRFRLDNGEPAGLVATIRLKRAA